MTDQRLAGLSLAELHRMAHAGDPSVSEVSHVALTRMSGSLRTVARTLADALSRLRAGPPEVGTGPPEVERRDGGWRGRAALAAEAEIGGHARWAEVTAARLSTSAEDVERYAASARRVIPRIDQLAAEAGATPVPTANVTTGPPHLTSAVAPSAASAVVVDLAAVEQSRADATLLARELFAQHAGVCGSASSRMLSTAHVAGVGARASASAAEGDAVPVNRVGSSASAPAEATARGRAAASAGSAGLGPRGRLIVPGGASAELPGGLPAADTFTGAGGTTIAGRSAAAGGATLSGGPQPRWGSATARLWTESEEHDGDAPNSAKARARFAGPAGDQFGPPRRGGATRYALPPGGVLGAERTAPHRFVRAGPAPKASATTDASSHGGSAGPNTAQRGTADTDTADPNTAELGTADTDTRDRRDEAPAASVGMMPPLLGAVTGHQETQRPQSPDYLSDTAALFEDSEWVAPPVIGR